MAQQNITTIYSFEGMSKNMRTYSMKKTKLAKKAPQNFSLKMLSTFPKALLLDDAIIFLLLIPLYVCSWFPHSRK